MASRCGTGCSLTSPQTAARQRFAGRQHALQHGMHAHVAQLALQARGTPLETPAQAGPHEPGGTARLGICRPATTEIPAPISPLLD